MKKGLFFAPVGAVAIGAAVLYLAGKNKKAKKAAAKAAPAGAKSLPLKTCSYSFASGYKDARTVEVTMNYNPESFTFSEVSEDFLSETGDSHVGVIRGEDIGVQMEYAAFFGGEDFALYSEHIAAKHKGFERICCNGIDGIKFFDGKNLALAFPAAASDYLLITVVALGDNNDADAAALWADPQVKELLDSLCISAQ